MQLYNQIKQNIFPKGSGIALGVFDGVHLGHAGIIKNAVDFAKKNNLTSVVATFSNHPHSEITGQAPKLLSTFEDRLTLIENLGVDAFFALEFNSRLRHMSAQDYFTKVLVDCLNAKYISVGYDHKFGFNQEGTTDKLKEWGAKFSITVHVNQPINIHDEPISSTRIRKDLSAGQVKATSLLLGRYYSVHGKITQGLKRGTELGFPTANIMIPSGLIIPAAGVYAGFADLPGENKKKLQCVINIGYCPTFKESHTELKVEAHILDFPYKELYNQNIKIEFVERLRNEEKFSSKEELIKQIKKDCEVGRKILAV
ncbi:MAG: riboflavin biosynthesis protein RibF [Candidatus Melainabacteria bacterium RIFCSPLOWO2_02_FULL_35_15]|nr:MAG: riboflavin biosynthesis protein RibF [Candidatus Melainabacteria bacterium RIFCSPLOWO2_12_FULL_35_11]OGI14588.1 MAG: riboflavin biosynthesis protein RibF [Candidatus Melainabacteria bacterium RIFCSPLOWO2_02_FULL_35_15]